MIGLFFNRHTPSDILVRTSLIYKYTCDCCQQSYIGSTTLQLFRRCAQRRGASLKTGRFLTRARPDNSAIRDHCFNLNHPFKMSNFYIIDTAEKLLDLRILESIHIINNRTDMYIYICIKIIEKVLTQTLYTNITIKTHFSSSMNN